MKRVYKGFTFHNYLTESTLALYDVQVVVQDLLSHIFTPIRGRVMMPTFGTRIPLLMFQQMTPDILAIIKDDITNVVNFDPRVRLVDIGITPNPDNNVVVCAVTLIYIELNLQDTLYINIQL